MAIFTEERADDLVKFYQKIYDQFRKKGVSADETFTILTIMMCSIGKRMRMSREEVIGYLERRWDNWDAPDEEE